jgi:hypothetical protein
MLERKTTYPLVDSGQMWVGGQAWYNIIRYWKTVAQRLQKEKLVSFQKHVLKLRKRREKRDLLTRTWYSLVAVNSAGEWSVQTKTARGKKQCSTEFWLSELMGASSPYLVVQWETVTTVLWIQKSRRMTEGPVEDRMKSVHSAICSLYWF